MFKICFWTSPGKEGIMELRKKIIGRRSILALLLTAICIGLFAPSGTEAAALPKPVFTVTKRSKTTATIKIQKKGTVTGYQVWTSTSKNGKYKQVDGIRTQTCKLKKLKPNKAYYVKIRAFRTTKNFHITYGKFSAIVKIGKYQKPKPEPKPTEKPEDTSEKYAEEVLRLVNKERKAAGLEALELDETLTEAANVRAEEITKQFSHTRPDGSSAFTVLQEYEYSYMAAGENIAAGQPDPESVVESWMNSEGHRANILSGQFKKLGVGYCKIANEYQHYWVQLFSD